MLLYMRYPADTTEDDDKSQSGKHSSQHRMIESERMFGSSTNRIALYRIESKNRK